MNSPRSEDLCKVSGLLHHIKVFSLPPVLLNPEACSCRSSKRYWFSPCPILCCCKGWSESILFLAVAHYGLRSIDNIGEYVGICATGSAGEGVLYAFYIEFLLCCWSAEDGGWHSVRWAWVKSGGLRGRYTEWTLMSALTTVFGGSAVNLGFELPPIGMNEVPLS